MHGSASSGSRSQQLDPVAAANQTSSNSSLKSGAKTRA